MIENPKGCGNYEDEITVPYGRHEFRPFNRGIYRNNLQCQWTFYPTDEFSRIRVRFKFFSLEGIFRGSCVDYLIISVLNVTTDNELLNSGRLCGRTVPSDIYFVYGEKLVLEFSSDSFLRYSGFEIEALSTVPWQCDIDAYICPTISFSVDHGSSLFSFTGQYNYTGQENGRPTYTNENAGSNITFTPLSDHIFVWAIVNILSKDINAYSDMTSECLLDIPRESWKVLIPSTGYENIDAMSNWNLTCISECAALEIPPNSHLVFRGDNSVGTSTIFECEEDYAQCGDKRRICLRNLRWGGQQLKCKAVCSQPEYGNGSDIVMNSTQYVEGDIIRYNCLEGFFYFSGDEQRLCQHNRTWTGEQLHCTEGCRSPANGKNSEVLSKEKYYPIGGNVTYLCLKGFIPLDGNKKRTCLSGLDWSDEPLACVAGCHFPDIRNNSFILPIKIHYLAGSNITYLCVEGFEEVSGDKIRTCLPEVGWSGESLVCVMKASKNIENMVTDAQIAVIASATGLFLIVGSILMVFFIRRYHSKDERNRKKDSYSRQQVRPTVDKTDNPSYTGNVQYRSTENGGSIEMGYTDLNQSNLHSNNTDENISYEIIEKPKQREWDFIANKNVVEESNLNQDENACNVYSEPEIIQLEIPTKTVTNDVEMTENDIYSGDRDSYDVPSSTMVDNDLYNIYDT